VTRTIRRNSGAEITTGTLSGVITSQTYWTETYTRELYVILV
jgi:hypothetical protein